MFLEVKLQRASWYECGVANRKVEGLAGENESRALNSWQFCSVRGVTGHCAELWGHRDRRRDHCLPGAHSLSSREESLPSSSPGLWSGSHWERDKWSFGSLPHSSEAISFMSTSNLVILPMPSPLSRTFLIFLPLKHLCSKSQSLEARLS